MVTRQRLREQIEIIDPTFERFNLEVIDVGVGSIDEDGWFDVIVELTTIDGEALEYDVEIKVNIYDDYGIVFNECVHLKDNFYGYDTIKIPLQENDLASIASSMIVFATEF